MGVNKRVGILKFKVFLKITAKVFLITNHMSVAILFIGKSNVLETEIVFVLENQIFLNLI